MEDLSRKQNPSTPVMIRLNDDLKELSLAEGGLSDDGGSSSEILRCLGGPSIGDIRSRLIRLIPVPGNGVTDLEYGDEERLKGIEAAHDLFAQRFPASCTERQAKDMWGDIIEGKSELWKGIPEDRREAMRAIPERCEISHPAPQSISSNRTSRNPSYSNVRQRSDSMSFDTAHRTYSEDDETSTDSDSSTITDENDVSSSGFDITRSESDTNFRPQRALPGSPWRDPLRLTETEKMENERVDPDALGQSLRSMASKTRNNYKRALRKPTEEAEEMGGNALYVKGTQEVPLESRIESESYLTKSVTHRSTNSSLCMIGLFYIENAYGHEIFPDPNTEMIKQLKLKETLALGITVIKVPAAAGSKFSKDTVEWAMGQL
ncbi:hypothetical protein QFC19_000154 [Naganishia cerealis]|uniref:Uncharacterized protein n=1 Tax=Naganishia cerealis TaxID=610337 RepID=A0ACC2WR92_9TREE|nr:hypothetical protein QFC19_000154 [Naganishia cerealis]